MSAEMSELVKALGKIAPQYFNKTEVSYEFLEGFAGAAFYMLRGSMIIDAFSGDANITKTYSEKIHGFAITNDGTGEDVVTVSFGGMTITLFAGETFDDHFKVGQSNLTVTSAGVPYRMVVRV